MYLMMVDIVAGIGNLSLKDETLEK